MWDVMVILLRAGMNYVNYSEALGHPCVNSRSSTTIYLRRTVIIYTLAKNYIERLELIVDSKLAQNGDSLYQSVSAIDQLCESSGNPLFIY